MKPKLKILLLEDFESDASLICRVIKKAQIEFDILVVDTKDGFIKALMDFSPDIILSDHTLPSFNSLEALKILAQKGVRIPFILVTGTMTEEFAVNVMKEGAWDYIPKNDLQQLPDAINKALDKFKYEKLRQNFLYEAILNEAYMQEAERIAHYGSWEADMLNKKFKLSKEAYNILGYDPGETEYSYENLLSRVHPEETVHMEQLLKHVLSFPEFKIYKDIFRLKDKDGRAVFIKTEFVLKYNFNKNLIRINGFIQDITELITLEDKLRESEERYSMLAASINDAATNRSPAGVSVTAFDIDPRTDPMHAQGRLTDNNRLLQYVNPVIQYSGNSHPLKKRGNWQVEQ